MADTAEAQRRGTCRSCHAPILWVTTTKGADMPVDPEPSSDGNVQLTAHGDLLFAHVLGTHHAAAAREHDTPLHQSHFATCPNAAQHRKARR